MRCTLKKFSLLFITIVAVFSLGATMALAAGVFPGAKSDPITITVPTHEPMTVVVEQMSRAANALGEYDIYRGESIILTYKISNKAPQGVDYVVELVPTIQGEEQQTPDWELRQLEGEISPSLKVNPQGPAHLMVRGGKDTKVELVITWPRGIIINPLPSVMVTLNVMRKNCLELEGCPWG